MVKFIDRTGQVFGRLAVIKRAGLISPVKWLCKCSCGNEKIVDGKSLSRKLTISCGCWKKEGASKRLLKNLIGQRFGRLIVIDRSKSSSIQAKWLCKCDCGNETIVFGANLRKGTTISCGCYISELRTKMNNDNCGENHPNWKGGISFEPYCLKFNDEFKERVRSQFEYSCLFCGKHEKELRTKLCVHHVDYDKKVCCNDRIPLFAALCKHCHGKTATKDRSRWQYMLRYIIYELYNRKCYLLSAK